MIALHIEIILLVTGVITASMLLQFLAPATMIRRNFGGELSGAASTLMARHWGLLVFCLGALLIYAAKHAEIREPVMIAAAVEKVGLIVLVLTGPLRKHPMALVIACADTVMTLLYVGYLLGF